MKKMFAVGAVVASLFLTAAAPVSAGHVVVRGRVWIGGPYWGPYWGAYGYPPYYPPAYAPAYPAPIVAEPQPQSYIYLAPASQAAPAPSYWYYCEGAHAYYPYVQQCPGGWLTVVPPAAAESPR